MEYAEFGRNFDAGLKLLSVVGIAILEQRAILVAFRVVELTAAHCPKKGAKAAESQKKGNRYQHQQLVHDGLLPPGDHRAKRKAFSTTRIDEEDMANAAISGVT